MTGFFCCSSVKDGSIPELINGVKIYDYDLQKNDVYSHKDIKYSISDEPAEERIKTLEKRIDELQEDVKAFRDKGWYLISSGDLQETKPGSLTLDF